MPAGQAAPLPHPATPGHRVRRPGTALGPQGLYRFVPQLGGHHPGPTQCVHACSLGLGPRDCQPLPWLLRPCRACVGGGGGGKGEAWEEPSGVSGLSEPERRPLHIPPGWGGSVPSAHTLFSWVFQLVFLMTSWNQIENKAPEKTLLFLWDGSRQEGNVFAVLCIFSSFISLLEWSQGEEGGKAAPGP